MSNTADTGDAAQQASRIAARYIRVWNEQDAARRRALVGEVFAPEARYVDPMASSERHEGIDAMIAAVQQRFAGLRFEVSGKQDGYNNVARFSWTLGAPGAEPVARGTDVVVLEKDGRISSVTGFIDALALTA